MALSTFQRARCLPTTSRGSSGSSIPVVKGCSSRPRCLTVVAFRIGGTGSSTTSNKISSKAKEATNKAKEATGRVKEAASKKAPISNKRSGSSKQRFAQPPNATKTEKQDKDSVVSFVAIAALFLTGIVFVLPALVGGSPATSVGQQQAINKAFNIKPSGSVTGAADAGTSNKGYAPGPGPAAAPGTPATQQ